MQGVVGSSPFIHTIWQGPKHTLRVFFFLEARHARFTDVFLAIRYKRSIAIAMLRCFFLSLALPIFARHICVRAAQHPAARGACTRHPKKPPSVFATQADKPAPRRLFQRPCQLPAKTITLKACPLGRGFPPQWRRRGNHSISPPPLGFPARGRRSRRLSRRRSTPSPPPNRQSRSACQSA